MKEIRNNEKGTHVIIHAIIFIAVCVVSIAILSLTPHPDFNSDQIPTLGCISSHNDTGYFITIDKVDPDPFPIYYSSCYVFDNAGISIGKLCHFLHQITNLDINENSTNISFLDTDLDGNISAGDQMYLRDKDHGGLVGNGSKVIFIFDITDDKMNGNGTVLRK